MFQQIFQHLCSGNWGCARTSTSAANDGEELKEGRGGLLEALSLKPSVVDDGELQFPPRSQARIRGNPGPRPKSSGRGVQKTQTSYAGADFQDLPNASLLRMGQWTDRADSQVWQERQAPIKS
ncbi:unnamed protein product [Effrenium voratum]|nr:unnamed protein product [Effrenium voratum]CAJ1447666.1 unnamed protein product [Effrenium voratum]